MAAATLAVIRAHAPTFRWGEAVVCQHGGHGVDVVSYRAPVCSLSPMLADSYPPPRNRHDRLAFAVHAYLESRGYTLVSTGAEADQEAGPGESWIRCSGMGDWERPPSCAMTPGIHALHTALTVFHSIPVMFLTRPPAMQSAPPPPFKK